MRRKHLQEAPKRKIEGTTAPIFVNADLRDYPGQHLGLVRRGEKWEIAAHAPNKSLLTVRMLHAGYRRWANMYVPIDGEPPQR